MMALSAFSKPQKMLEMRKEAGAAKEDSGTGSTQRF